MILSLKKNKLIFGASILSILFFVLTFGQVVHAQSDRTGGGAATGITYDCNLDNNGGVMDPQGWGNCDFQDFLAAIQKLVNWGTTFGLAFTVVVLAYAGFLYLTSGGSAGQRKQANDMFVKVAWGIAYILGAWMIVHFIVAALLTKDALSAVPL